MVITCKFTDSLKSKLNSYNIQENLNIEDQEIQNVLIKLKRELPKYSEDEVMQMKEITINNDKNIGKMMDVIYGNIFGDKF